MKDRLLKISTSGVKVLANTCTINFAQSTLTEGVKGFNSLKGIYGCNGDGKTAIILSVWLYKKICTESNYLIQDSTTRLLDRILNYDTKTFKFASYFEYDNNEVIRHYIEIGKDDFDGKYIIKEESISIINGRTLSDKPYVLIEKFNGEPIDINPKYTNQGIGLYSFPNVDFNSMLFSFMKGFKGTLINSKLENILLRMFINLLKIHTFVNDETETKVPVDQELIFNIIDQIYDEESAVHLKNAIQSYDVSETISKKDLERYEMVNKLLYRFLEIFLPDIKDIELVVKESRDILEINKMFVYEKYKVELCNESAGLRQLVKMFPALIASANGGISFVDELDANIATVYLSKMVEFFMRMGRGQICFTCHNIEVMNVLKEQAKSIISVGRDGSIYTWVRRGNATPTKDFMESNFLNCAMNVEASDYEASLLSWGIDVCNLFYYTKAEKEIMQTINMSIKQ